MNSNFAKWSIGVTALIGAAAMVYAAATAGDLLPHGSGPVYGMAAFFSLIAVACFVTSAQPIAIRIVAGVVFIVDVIIVVTSINDENFPRMIKGFLIIGLPCGYVAIWGRYPKWGQHAEAFHPNEKKSG